MRDLIRQIIKEESDTQTKLLNVIEKSGIKQTIKMVGGFKTFESLLPNYFINDERKIDLINELVEEYEEEYGDFIWFENIETDEIRYGEGEDEEGNSLVTYLVSVDTDGVGYRTYKYDSDEILDMDFEEGSLKMKYLEEDIINQIFKKLVNYFLVKDVSTPN